MRVKWVGEVTYFVKFMLSKINRSLLSLLLLESKRFLLKPPTSTILSELENDVIEPVWTSKNLSTHTTRSIWCTYTTRLDRHTNPQLFNISRWRMGVLTDIKVAFNIESRHHQHVFPKTVLHVSVSLIAKMSGEWRSIATRNSLCLVFIDSALYRPIFKYFDLTIL